MGDQYVLLGHEMIAIALASVEALEAKMSRKKSSHGVFVISLSLSDHCGPQGRMCRLR